jgi:hypothetical protein
MIKNAYSGKMYYITNIKKCYKIWRQQFNRETAAQANEVINRAEQNLIVITTL